MLSIFLSKAYMKIFTIPAPFSPNIYNTLRWRDDSGYGESVLGETLSTFILSILLIFIILALVWGIINFLVEKYNEPDSTIKAIFWGLVVGICIILIEGVPAFIFGWITA